MKSNRRIKVVQLVTNYINIDPAFIVNTFYQFMSDRKWYCILCKHFFPIHVGLRMYIFWTTLNQWLPASPVFYPPTVSGAVKYYAMKCVPIKLGCNHLQKCATFISMDENKWRSDSNLNLRNWLIYTCFIIYHAIVCIWMGPIGTSKIASRYCIWFMWELNIHVLYIPLM